MTLAASGIRSAADSAPDDWRLTPAHRSPIVNGLSVDVEDYFHVSAFDNVVARERWHVLESRVCASTDRLLALFDAAGVKATFFVLGWVAERHPALIKRISRGGHEIASHGYDHKLVYKLTPEQFRVDVRRTKAVLESLSGEPVLGYRAPSFSITDACRWAFDVLIEEGYLYDASVYPIRHDRYGIPNACRHVNVIERPAGVLWELPGSTARLGGLNLPIGGGGYFRLLPYWWTRWGINRLNQRERQPAIFYLHPWEIDPEQPRFSVPSLSRMRHYGGLAETELRLRQLLRDFSFGPLNAIVQDPTWAVVRPFEAVDKVSVPAAAVQVSVAGSGVSQF
jgi:polysaccharide deacetylase family protein (PEP-CTERM system associated)